MGIGSVVGGLPEEGDEKEGGMGLFSSDGVVRKR
jgi:hypothetical protein